MGGCPRSPLPPRGHQMPPVLPVLLLPLPPSDSGLAADLLMTVRGLGGVGAALLSPPQPRRGGPLPPQSRAEAGREARRPWSSSLSPAPGGAVLPRPPFSKGCCDCGTRCDSSGLGGGYPSSPPPPRNDPDAARASFLHLTSPGAAGRGAASQAPGPALPGAVAAPWGRGVGAGGPGPEGRREPRPGSTASSFHRRVVVQQPEEREPRAPRKTSRAHKQSHVGSGGGAGLRAGGSSGNKGLEPAARDKYCGGDHGAALRPAPRALRPSPAPRPLRAPALGPPRRFPAASPLRPLQPEHPPGAALPRGRPGGPIHQSVDPVASPPVPCHSSGRTGGPLGRAG